MTATPPCPSMLDATKRQPLFLEQLPALREKLARAERDRTRLGQVWSSVRRRSQAAPLAFPWFTPLVALVTQQERDIDAARQTLRNYVSTFDGQAFGMGLQFHFWCFAFPHARWSLYFQWLDAIGAWDPREAQEIREELITFQFANFFYGMRTKPEPECVDNQTMSLCFSNALIGELFGKGPDASKLAARMGVDGLRRLPSMLGGLPPSGYSGEGSTYMDYVVGPCIPYLVELLERTIGGNWFEKPMPPLQGSAANVLKMIAREWIPGGLLWPIDDYGYGMPVRSAIAYAAHRTEEALYVDLLENHADWSHEIGVGWGYDDVPWALIWWPEKTHRSASKTFVSWAEHDFGAVLVSRDSTRYLAQHWDESTPGFPGRAHVNPNAITLSAWGSPLTMDGATAKGCEVFNFDDTWLERTGQDFNTVRMNFGRGCAAAHSVLIVDGHQGMHVKKLKLQAELVSFDEASNTVIGDVTPQYREHWPDTQRVWRRSRLVDEKFWLIEDLAQFTNEHEITARWWLRPEQVQTTHGLAIQTAEGVRLDLIPIVGADAKQVQMIEGYPAKLEFRSVRADFTQRGKIVRWLWAAVPTNTRAVAQELGDAWQAAADQDASWDATIAREKIATHSVMVPFTQPAFMVAELPVVSRWWYRRKVKVQAGAWWLRLPRNLRQATLWVEGREIDLSGYEQVGQLMQIQVPLHAERAGEVEVLVRTDTGVSQYGLRGEKDTGSSFWGVPAVLVPREPQPVQAMYQNHEVQVLIGEQIHRVPVALLPTC